MGNDQVKAGGDLVGTTADAGTHHEGELSAYTTDERARLRALMNAGDASDADLDMLAIRSQRSGLDPFLGQIYLVGRKTKTGGYRGEPERWETKWTVQTGIDGFRKVLFRAAETAGVSCEIGRPTYIDENGGEHRIWMESWGNPPAVEVKVTLGDRTGWGIATWDQFVQTKRDGTPNSMWSKMGPLMLAKCAKAQAIRDVCDMAAGLYIDEEMGQADNIVRAEARRVTEPVGRGSAGLQAALESRAEPDPADLSEIAHRATTDIAGITVREEIPALLDQVQPNVSPEEYKAVRAAATARWYELGDAADDPAGADDPVDAEEVTD